MARHKSPFTLLKRKIRMNFCGFGVDLILSCFIFVRFQAALDLAKRGLSWLSVIHNADFRAAGLEKLIGPDALPESPSPFAFLRGNH